MPAGCVYILSNSSLRDGLLKVGKTTGPAENRARSLRATGVPTHFTVEHSVQVADCGLVETLVHRRLAQYRHAPDREFFEAPLALAISVLDHVIGETMERGAARVLEKEWEESVREIAGDRLDPDSRLSAFQMRVDRCSETIQDVYRSLRGAVEGWPGVAFKVDAKIDGMNFKRGGRNFFTLHPKHSANPDNIGIAFWLLQREEVRA